MAPESSPQLLRAGEMLDRIMTADMRLYFEEQVCAALYESARRATTGGSNGPLSLRAAERILSRVQRGNVVVVMTGWPTAYRPCGETDGPLGAVVLARAIARACEATPVFIGEPDVVGSIVPLCYVAGLNVLDLGTAKTYKYSAHVRSVPIGNDPCRKASEELLVELRPSCVISVERPGRNEKGVHHYTRGVSASEGIAHLDYLFAAAHREHILTVGIGDLGNELGLGKIKETVAKHVKLGAKCLCPCGGGIAAADPADVTIFSTTSNWGAYGVAAALAILNGDAAVFHSGDIERALLHAAREHGIVDGALDVPSLSVDTIPEDADAGLVEMMGVIVRKALR